MQFTQLSKWNYRENFYFESNGLKQEENCLFEVINRLFHISLLLLVLSVGDYIAQIFVVQVSGNIQGEVGEHLVHLEEITQDTSGISSKKSSCV